MKKNLLLIHGGAPTAVMNASLYGAVCQAMAQNETGRVLGARGGSGGVLRRQFVDLGALPAQVLARLPCTPGSFIGTSRDHLEPEDYTAMSAVIKEQNIGYVLFNGGNGSMDACGKLGAACAKAKIRVQMVGIPKTIDNDLAVTDHAPGFGSAARYMAGTVGEIARDVSALPIHVCVVEALGRNAGWVAAASCFARTGKNTAPHLLCFPERPFAQDAFLARIETLHKQHGGVVVVVGEGLRNPAGTPIVKPIFRAERAVYYGDVSAHLAGLVIKNLGIKARCEKPGLAGRASVAWQSQTDRHEAELCGREAVRAVMDGHTGVMVGLVRGKGPIYSAQTQLIPIEQVMLTEKTLPDEFISADGTDVTPAFIKWCSPLLGGPLPKYAILEER